MNWTQLIRLFVTIFYGKPPNIRMIQEFGLLAVKIGQTYAQRADFLSEPACRELAKLYRQTTPAPPAEIKELLLHGTPNGWSSAFVSIDPKPLASASVGQIHRAKLETGEPVVVKIVREEFQSRFKQDCSRVHSLLKWLVRFYPKLARVADPIGTLKNIEEQTLAELNLQNEIEGQDRLRTIYHQYKDDYELAKLQFPKIYRSLSDTRLMVSEFVDGPTLDELLESNQLEYESLLDLFQIHGFFLFCTGTFHGDIHPGNIILKDGSLYFLDTGAISQVPDAMRQGLFHFFDAIIHGDFESSAAALAGMSRTPLPPNRYRKFQAAFQSLYSGFLGKSVAELSLTKQMMQTVRLAVDHGMNFETGMYPIIKSLMYLDGMVLRCAPETDLMADLKPFLDRFRPWVGGQPEPASTKPELAASN